MRNKKELMGVFFACCLSYKSNTSHKIIIKNPAERLA